MLDHRYSVDIEWTGNRGTGTSGYRDYDRSHRLAAKGKSAIDGSSDPAFRGDRTRWNPEELLVGATAACHQLWYLHLCADAGIVVTRYEDSAVGVMREDENGSGVFTDISLVPRVEISPESDLDRAIALHAEAHGMCFIAASLRCKVRCEPDVRHAELLAGVSP